MPFLRPAFALSFALMSSLALAAAQRTFVSTTGVNNPSCSLASPCRDFTSAIAATSAGGEVIVLDSGGYGSVTIGQAVSIIAPPGVYAGISVFAGDDGVTVAAGPADKVTLRGLSINGQGGNRGIVIASGGEVNIEQCIVANMGGDGIQVNGGHAISLRGSILRGNGGHGLDIAAGAPEVHALDSNFSNNLGHGILVAAGSLDAARIAADINGDNGVRAEPATGSAQVTLTDSSFQGNTQTGAAAATTVASSKAYLAVARSTSSRNAGAGFGANSFDVGTAFLTVAESAALENDGNGVVVNGTNATGIVSNSTLARNLGFDLDQKGAAVLRTSGNNALTGRGAPDIGGTLTSNPLK
jgi:hypothetical protein